MSDYIIGNKDTLYHYGILGMKWGRRKSPNELSDSDKQKSVRSIKKSLSRLLMN